MGSGSKIRFKEIRLLPTAFTLDVWVGQDYDRMAKLFKKRYGASKEYYIPELQSANFVATIHGTKKSKIGESIRIIMVLEGFSPSILVHETTHVCWHLSNVCNVELNYDSQEWHACMMETIVEACLDKKTFKKL